MGKLLVLVVLTSLWILPLGAQSPGRTRCSPDVTLSATGRTAIAGLGTTINPEQFASLRVMYYTTGAPTDVIIKIEDGNQGVSTVLPFVRLMLSNPGQGDSGFLPIGARSAWLNVVELSGGTSPTIVATACFTSATTAPMASGTNLSSNSLPVTTATDDPGILALRNSLAVLDQDVKILSKTMCNLFAQSLSPLKGCQ